MSRAIQETEHTKVKYADRAAERFQSPGGGKEKCVALTSKAR